MFFRFYFYNAESIFSAFIIDIHTFTKIVRGKKGCKTKNYSFH